MALVWRSYGAENVNKHFTDSLSFNSNGVFHAGDAFIIVIIDFIK
jgi:hypothetical protein